MSSILMNSRHNSQPIGMLLNSGSISVELWPTFGFLEEMLGKAIFAFSATREYPEDELEAAFERWLPTLERALVDPLGSLIESYGKAVRDNQNAMIANLDDLLEDIRKAARVRNVLCHGSWRLPDARGRSVPFFVNRQKEVLKRR